MSIPRNLAAGNVTPPERLGSRRQNFCRRRQVSLLMRHEQSRPFNSPARPRQRPGNVDDVVARRRWILFVPSDAETNLEIDTAHGPKLEVAVRQILRPLRCKANAKPRGNERHQRERVITAHMRILTSRSIINT